MCNLLNVGCIFPKLKPATIFSTIVTNSGHHESLKLKMPSLVVVRNECSHDCRSRTEAHNMRIHHKIDCIKGKGIYNLPGADATSLLVKIFPGWPLSPSLVLKMNPNDNHLRE